MRELRPPGVYPSHEQVKSHLLSAANTAIAGFVGMAQKGPLNAPVRIADWNQFVETFGRMAEGYLAKAVEGFFKNKGKVCFVVRIAHQAKAGQIAGTGVAVSAARTIADAWDKPTFRVEALNEGCWGNSIWISFEQKTGPKTLLTFDLDVGSGEARVHSTRGIEKGTLVRIFDNQHTDYVTVTEVEDRVLRWASTTPTNHRYSAAGPSYIEVVEFEVSASLKNRFEDKREVFQRLQLSPLSRRYASRIINEESQLIRLLDLKSTAPLPHNLPRATPPAKLTGGQDGLDVLTAADFIGHDHGPEARAGLMSLGAIDEVAMIAVPDAVWLYTKVSRAEADQELERVQEAAISMCERLQDRFAILDSPPTRDIEEVRKWRRRFYSSYAAIYFPWLSLDGDDDLRAAIPPSGHVAGVFARCETESGVHKAPANEVIEGVQSVALRVTEEHLGLLHQDAVNTIRVLPGRGVRIWGSRTLSDDADWVHVNVRRLFVMLRRSLDAGTQWAVFEPNDPRTWDLLVLEVNSFLKTLWERGSFAGDTAEDSFFVRCDETTNTPELRDRGQLLVEVGIAPALPAEFIIFTLVQRLGDTEQAPATAEASV